MTTAFPVSIALLTLAVAAATVALAYFRRSTAVLTAAMLVLFPLLSDTSHWDWFDGIKRDSLLIPSFLWAFIHGYPDNRLTKYFVRAMPLTLFINILEVAGVDLLWPSPLNGILMACTAFCGPVRLSYDEGYRRWGFRNVFWQLAFVMTLGRLYVLNAGFKKIFAAAIMILVLASAFCLFERDTHNWLTWRIYTIYPILLQDSVLPKLSKRFYPAWLHADVRTKWHGTPFANVWLAINVAVVAAMIFDRVRGMRRSAT